MVPPVKLFTTQHGFYSWYIFKVQSPTICRAWGVHALVWMQFRAARSLHFWGQILNNALCFSLYLPFVFFVYLTTLMTIWPQKCSDLATLMQFGFRIAWFEDFSRDYVYKLAKYKQCSLHVFLCICVFIVFSHYICWVCLHVLSGHVHRKCTRNQRKTKDHHKGKRILALLKIRLNYVQCVPKKMPPVKLWRIVI